MKFSQWLAEHRRGELDAELTMALGEITQAVGLVGKSGRLVVEVAIKANGPGARTLTVVDKVRIGKPEAERETAIYYVDSEAKLTREDPYQQRLPVRELEDTKGEVKR